jgi:hypothetical protein
MTKEIQTIDYKDWMTEALKRYPDRNITFVCPVCGYQQSVRDLEAARCPEGSWGFACIGRRLEKCRKAFGESKKKRKKKNGPCDYTGGGLLRLNPVHVRFEDGTIHSYFDFADDPLCPKEEKP